MKTSIEVKIRIDGIHQWPDAPFGTLVSFLRAPHRHEFVIRARFYVNQDDRELEFFTVKEELRRAVFDSSDDWKLNTPDIRNFYNCSCEQIAKNIYYYMPNNLKPYWIGVWEDDENGAIIEFN